MAVGWGWWVHFQHSLSTSSQWQWLCLFVLFLFLVLFPFAQVHLLLCSLCFLHQCQCLVFLLFCVLLPLISSAVFLCACAYPRCLLHQGLPVPCFVWRVLPRSPAGAVAVNKGRHQLAGGIIGEVQAVLLDCDTVNIRIHSK